MIHEEQEFISRVFKEMSFEQRKNMLLDLYPTIDVTILNHTIETDIIKFTINTGRKSLINDYLLLYGCDITTSQEIITVLEQLENKLINNP